MIHSLHRTSETVTGNNDMVIKSNSEQLSGIIYPLGNFLILIANIKRTVRMIVGDDYGGSPIFHCGRKYLSRMNERSRKRANRYCMGFYISRLAPSSVSITKYSCFLFLMKSNCSTAFSVLSISGRVFFANFLFQYSKAANTTAALASPMPLIALLPRRIIMIIYFFIDFTLW
jgi:hypothetical protein